MFPTEQPVFDFGSDFFANQANMFSPNMMNMDFMSLMLQQLPMLTMMYSQSPASFSLGLPDVVNTQTSAGMGKRIASMKLSKESCQQIGEMSKRLNISPDNLKALIYSESGGNPQAVNKKSGATGLIQFMPSTAKGLGITTAQLHNMTAEQQLPYVEKYLARAKRSAGFGSDQQLSAGQLYALVFMPAKAKQSVMCSAGTKAYAWNQGLDKNRDGVVSIGELGARIT